MKAHRRQVHIFKQKASSAIYFKHSAGKRPQSTFFHKVVTLDYVRTTMRVSYSKNVKKNFFSFNTLFFGKPGVQVLFLSISLGHFSKSARVVDFDFTAKQNFSKKLTKGVAQVFTRNAKFAKLSITFQILLHIFKNCYYFCFASN